MTSAQLTSMLVFRIRFGPQGPETIEHTKSNQDCIKP